MLWGAGALIAAAPGLTRAAVKAAGWDHNAILIDGMGGISDPYAPNDELRLSDRANLLRLYGDVWGG